MGDNMCDSFEENGDQREPAGAQDAAVGDTKEFESPIEKTRDLMIEATHAVADFATSVTLIISKMGKKN